MRPAKSAQGPFSPKSEVRFPEARKKTEIRRPSEACLSPGGEHHAPRTVSGGGWYGFRISDFGFRISDFGFQVRTSATLCRKAPRINRVGGRFLQFFRANPCHPRSHPARSDRGTRGFARKMHSALPIQPVSFSPPLRHPRFRFGQKRRCRVQLASEAPGPEGAR